MLSTYHINILSQVSDLGLEGPIVLVLAQVAISFNTTKQFSNVSAFV